MKYLFKIKVEFISKHISWNNGLIYILSHYVQ